MLRNINLADPEKAELNISFANLIDQDVVDYVIPFLAAHPKISKLLIGN